MGPVQAAPGCDCSLPSATLLLLLESAVASQAWPGLAAPVSIAVPVAAVDRPAPPVRLPRHRSPALPRPASPHAYYTTLASSVCSRYVARATR